MGRCRQGKGSGSRRTLRQMIVPLCLPYLEVAIKRHRRVEMVHKMIILKDQ